MERTKPISPQDMEQEPEFELNQAIGYLNSKIILRDWHEQSPVVEGYHAIIFAPYGAYSNVRDMLVEKFRAEGWDCKWGHAGDARGPHDCFYVSKRHFETFSVLS